MASEHDPQAFKKKATLSYKVLKRQSVEFEETVIEGHPVSEFDFSASPSSYSYIRSELSRGGAFANCLLRVPLEEGRVTAFLPAAFDPSADLDFEEGFTWVTGLQMVGVRTKTAGFIAHVLSEEGQRYAVFETFYKADRAFPGQRPPRYFLYDARKFVFVTSEEPSVKRVFQGIYSAGSYPFVCGLTSLRDDQHPLASGETVPPSVLEQLAERTSHMVIGAFDAEGFIIWSRE